MKNSTLQNFTKMERKAKRLLSKNPVPKEQFDKLTAEERKVFSMVVNEKLCSLKHHEKDEYLKKLEEQLEFYSKDEFKFTVWEINHLTISRCIENYVSAYGRFPTRTHIATMTDLSRPTINKHLETLQSSKHYKQYTAQFTMMTDRVIGAMTKSAIEGNVSAQRLFLEFVSGQTSKRIGTQNNYIQINGFTLTEEKLRTLPADQLKAIENILMDSEAAEIT
ncbi:hypothetical protein [Chryseobacterium sp. A321]